MWYLEQINRGEARESQTSRWIIKDNKHVIKSIAFVVLFAVYNKSGKWEDRGVDRAIQRKYTTSLLSLLLNINVFCYILLLSTGNVFLMQLFHIYLINPKIPREIIPRIHPVSANALGNANAPTPTIKLNKYTTAICSNIKIKYW